MRTAVTRACATGVVLGLAAALPVQADDLLALNGVYTQLYETQFNREKV